MQKIKMLLGGLFAVAFTFIASAIPALAQYVSDPLDEEGAVDVLTGMVGTVSGTLGGTLPVLFALVAVLIGLFFVVRQVQKRIGRGQ